MGHLPQSQLREGLEKAKQQITIGGRYAHYKDTSKTYVVRDIAILEATEEPCVIYEAEYDEKITFVRPVREWLDEIGKDDAKMPRFKLLG